MAKDQIRVGKVSSVNHEAGMLSVTYPDRDGSTTVDLPVLSHCDEYKMPPVGADVLVLHMANGMASGVVLGRYWNVKNRPEVSGIPYAIKPGTYRQELGEEHGQAYIEFSGGTLTLHAESIVLDAKNIIINGDSMKVNTQGGLVSVADITAGGKSLMKHIHTDSVGGRTTKPD